MLKKSAVVSVAVSLIALSACREELSACREEDEKTLTWELTERTVFRDGVEVIDREYLPTLDECRAEIENRELQEANITLAFLEKGKIYETLYTFLDRRCMPVSEP